MKKLFSKIAVAIVTVVFSLTTVLVLPTCAQASNTQTKQAVVISDIRYNGAVKRTESDEYVEITNSGLASVDVSGWRIKAGDTTQDFSFPKGTVLSSRKSFRVYTDEVHPETGGFKFGIKRAIWNNKGGVGRLYDGQGRLVDSFNYPKQETGKKQVNKRAN